MGRRSGIETAVSVLRAFVERRRWTQADLARNLGLTVPALRKHLEELAKIYPFTSTKEHPDVVWERPRDWHPAGTLLGGAEVAMLVRLLARAPRSVKSEAMIGRLLRTDPRLAAAADGRRVIEREEEEQLCVVEDSLLQRRPIRIEYFSQRRARSDSRVVSVAWVSPGRRASFLGVCHRTGDLRSFRLSGTSRAAILADVMYRSAASDELAKRIEASVDGYWGDGPCEVAFVLPAGAPAWIARNLPSGVASEVLADGSVRVTARAGLENVARFVVGLGGIARCETEILAERVRMLAEGALDSGKERARYLDIRSGTSNRASR